MELGKTHYVNGQRIWELNGSCLTYFYKSGKIKAKGDYINGQMQGKWLFYRETGQLGQIGHLKDDIKDGSWLRYDINGELEYEAEFVAGKLIKR
ncbi:hypothetical protein LJC57_04635 [Parabacteroides sp. OttesenSCG-928-G07]|nr:hypothetical protein [Parabacteroides sp. OttesenSCG-928-G07]